MQTEILFLQTSVRFHCARWLAFLVLPFSVGTFVDSDQVLGQDPTVDFNQEIRPILRQHCTGCHGGVKGAGGISFVYQQSAFLEGDSGTAAVVPGRPDRSEMIRRIEADEEERMPPADHGPRLKPKEVAAMKLWISQGAKWSEVWSLQPVIPSSVPNGKSNNPTSERWHQSPIDAFVYDQLEKHQLKPSPIAASSEWLRRVSFDLIGLPPSRDLYERFNASWKVSPEEAKRKVVDELLESPQFGEKWATMWLDLARYSDTYGYEKDPRRTIWPWRDWVIRAFNQDMPFDLFTEKQIAGDLLPNPSMDDILATAFHRNTQNNTEGGTDDEEFRYAAVVDRVNTIWTTWHATTFGCVRCHSHPYDPFTHEEYYRFIAFFNNSEDCDQNDDFPRIKWSDKDSERLLDTQKQLKELVSSRNDMGWKVAESVDDWNRLLPSKVSTTAGTIALQEGGVIESGGTLPVGVVSTVTLQHVDGVKAIRVHLLPESIDPMKWPERGQVISEIRMEAVTMAPDPGSAPGSQIETEQTSPPPRRREISARAVFADSLAGPFEPNESLEKGGAGFGAYPVMNGPRSCVILLSEPIPVGTDFLEIHLVQSMASNSGFQGCPLRRFRLEASRSNLWNEAGVDERCRVFAAKEIELRELLKGLQGEFVPILQERAQNAQRSTRLHLRGNVSSPAQAVVPGVPKVLQTSHLSAPSNRIELARWICSAENPLSSRTIANRLWAEMFGVGLVETLEDMGTSGAEPSHPELLDYLAHRLVHHYRWSLKGMIQEIALSETYGQTSKIDDVGRLKNDRANRLLSRGPRNRLTAEMIRDQALLLSGLFSSKMYGPPVFPPQPEGVWNTVYNGDTWKTSTGEDRYRRAIYTFQKRTSGYPGYLLFDAPSREFCSARRLPTNTPLQALATLNDPAFMELSQGFADRMVREGGTTEQKIRSGLRWLTLEDPDEVMVAKLSALHSQTKRALEQTPEDSKTLGSDLDTAAMVLVANAILNLDAFLVR